MAFTTPAMGLIVWNQPTDPYDSTQLAGNFAKLDEHDHTPGKGLPITTGAIADGAITSAKLDAGFVVPPGSVSSTELAGDSVTTANVLDGTLIPDDFSSTLVNDIVGLNSSGVIRRGKSIIAAPESRTNVAYGLMPTPDRVSNIVVPTDGKLRISYQALWQESVAGAARAAVFIGANQVQISGVVGVATVGPATQAARTGASTAAIDLPLASTSAGLLSVQGTSAASADVTTGQIQGIVATLNGLRGEIGAATFDIPSPIALGGFIEVFLAAGTYDVSVQFKASSGSVTAKNRKLWASAIGF